MKKILFLSGVFALMFLAFPLDAQQLIPNHIKEAPKSFFTPEHKCGLHDVYPEGVVPDLLKNRKDNPNFVRQRGAITYVPIKFHLVANSDGEGRLAEGKVLDMLCIVNNEYLQHEIQFYIKDGFNYIDHTNLYSNPSANSSWLKMQNEKVNNAVNVFVILSVGGNTAAYYQPPIGQADWIVIGSGYVYGEAVLSHELGHFFSLDHPFIGWEDVPYNEAAHGNPVNITIGPSPTFTGYTIEFQNGNNCNNSADAICDTPPDYLFGFVNGGGCANYNGETYDFNGDLTDPIENNMMSYFQNCDDYVFTTDQVDAIHLSLESPGRNYVNPGVTPVLDDVTSLPTLVSPAEGQAIGNQQIQFNWTAADGATRYLLEIDRLSSFSFQPQYYITTSTAKTVTLDENKTYFWRVRPFTNLKTCTTYSDVIEFETTTGVNTTEIDAVDSWTVRPNPVNANDNLVVEINSSKSFDATVKVFSMTGQLISSATNVFGLGSTTLEISTSGLSSGMYMVSVQSADGVMTKKVVVR